MRQIRQLPRDHGTLGFGQVPTVQIQADDESGRIVALVLAGRAFDASFSARCAALVLMPAAFRTADFNFPAVGSRTSDPWPTFCAFSNSRLISPMRTTVLMPAA